MRRFAPILVFLSGVALAVSPLSPASAINGWQKPVHIAAALEGVTCASATFCVATDPSTGLFYTYDGTSWSAPVSVMDQVYGEGLSCTSATFCMAVQSYGSPLWSMFDGTTWSAPATVPGATALASLACATPTFCIAADPSGNYYRFGAHGWNARGPMPFGPRTITCPSTTFCMAVSDKSVSIYDGEQWSAPVRVLGGQSSFAQASCASPGVCAAVTGLGVVIVYQDGQWTRNAKVMRRGWVPNSISCGAADFCVAADEQGHAAMGSISGQWTTVKVDKTGGGIAWVSCTADSTCALVEQSGNAITYPRGVTGPATKL